MRVLGIEDDQSVRDALRRALMLGGWEVVEANDGSTGLYRALDAMEPELNRSIPGDPHNTTTPKAMAEAMDRVVGYPASDLIDWTHDPVIAAIVRTWPATVETPRANALSLHAEASFDDIVRQYLADDNGQAGPLTRP